MKLKKINEKEEKDKNIFDKFEFCSLVRQSRDLDHGFIVCLCFEKWFLKNHFQTFLCLFAIRKDNRRKILSSQ
jgi:hypothetical protein